MSVVTNKDILALGLVGKIGRPADYGDKWYGWNEYGAFEDIYGIYRRRPTEKGVTLVKCQFYWPTNPQTAPQQSWRGVFTDGVIAYQALSEGEKETYRKEAEGKPLSGFNLYLREYLLAN